MYRCTSYNNDMPKETLISALYVNVFWFVIFFSLVVGGTGV